MTWVITYYQRKIPFKRDHIPVTWVEFYTEKVHMGTNEAMHLLT